MQRLRSIGGLTLLLVAIDQLHRWLHPEVDFVRASLVGLTALAALAALARMTRLPLRPLAGALAIAFSAFASVALIESGILVSRSTTSAVVHVALLATAVVALDRAGWLRAPAPAAELRS